MWLFSHSMSFFHKRFLQFCRSQLLQNRHCSQVNMVGVEHYSLPQMASTGNTAVPGLKSKKSEILFLTMHPIFSLLPKSTWKCRYNRMTKCQAAIVDRWSVLSWLDVVKLWVPWFKIHFGKILQFRCSSWQWDCRLAYFLCWQRENGLLWLCTCL